MAEGARVFIVPRSALNEAELKHITERVFAPEHELDTGPRPIWHLESYAPKLYVILLKEGRVPIGTIYIGGVETSIDVAWWIDSQYRGQRLGADTVDVLARLLKSNGVTGIGPIAVTAYGDAYYASARLVKRLRSYFPG